LVFEFILDLALRILDFIFVRRGNMSEKKYALVTGGSSGLGYAIAMKLAKKGFVTAVMARRKDKLDEAIDAIKKAGFESYGFQGDITSQKDLERIAGAVKAQFGKLDFLVLNAGVVTVSLLSDYTDFDKMKSDIDVDLWGTILSARIFMPLLVKGSRILMISSALGLIGAAGYSTYCAAKAGIINFAESLRRELLCKGITVHVACPADIDTPQYAEEQKSSPKWMTSGASARKSLLSPEIAAEKILAQCRGAKLICTINSEISLLRVLGKILPAGIMAGILDSSLPRPK
jgi:NAD(P)-dependent dehydrogenase (short-subunit alcohol dehydrogenase family)